VSLAARVVKVSSSGASGNSSAMHVEAARSVPSRSIIVTAVNIVGYRSASLSACDLNVSRLSYLMLCSKQLACSFKCGTLCVEI